VFLNCSTCFGRHNAHHQELKNCNYRFWFYIRFWFQAPAMAAAWNQKHMYNQNLQVQILSSWWWAVCLLKHVEQLRNTGIINSSTRSHLADSFYEICTKLLHVSAKYSSHYQGAAILQYGAELGDKTCIWKVTARTMCITISIGKGMFYYCTLGLHSKSILSVLSYFASYI